MDDHHDPGHRTLILPSLDGAPGLAVVDPIERLRRTIRTAEPVSPAPADTDAFPLPVEAAVTVETSGLSLPVESEVYVRDGDGRMLEEVEVGSRRTFAHGTYCLEPSWIVKVYVRVESSLEIDQHADGTRIRFDEPASVTVGSCSTHERPAATVSVSEDPGDLLAGISTFGSALKTTSPERAFPTFRGHPPRLELDDDLAVPEGLEPPTTSFHLEVPATPEAAFAVAPLAFYLGVDVREGSDPRLVGSGWEHPLRHDGALEPGVERLLGRVFLLDCVTRTEGLYRLDVHEREVLERRVDLDLEALYGAPHEDRVRSYLEVPHDSLADLVPDWKHAAHVEPVPESAEALPYLVHDLSLVRTADPEPVPDAAVQDGTAGTLVRGEATTETTFVQPADPTGTIEETWVGDGTPLGASKAIPEAFENRVGRSPSTGRIDIAVVCNDPAMDDEEDVLETTYGARVELPFDVTFRRDATVEELADVLAEERDFLHYVGHIDDDGFRCADGRLDVADLDDVGTDAFFLNACQSYEQGTELVRAGAIGGIVTVRDVANYGAVQIGGAVARLLNCGFPLRSALEVARGESVVGSHYIVVGDGSLAVVQPESGTPHLLEISRRGDEFEVTIELFGAQPGMGGLFSPHVADPPRHYLASGTVPDLRVDADEFEAFLHCENAPVRRNGWLSWTAELSEADF